MQDLMDAANTPHTPLPLPQPTQPSSQTTPIPSTNNFLPGNLYSLPPPTPGSQPAFTVPTFSPGDWYRLNQFTPLIQTMPYHPSAPPLQPDTTVLPAKRRGRPRKPRPSLPAANHSTSTSIDSPAIDPNKEPAHSLDLAGKCWFVPHEDGISDMDLVAKWCSHFENFTEWRTRPKHHAGEKVSSSIVAHGHPKRESRECEKKVGDISSSDCGGENS